MELSNALHRGEYILNEMIALIQMRKYREMKRRYGHKQLLKPASDSSSSRNGGIADEFYGYVAEQLPGSSVLYDHDR